MTYKYNKGIIVHIIMVVAVYLFLILLYDFLDGTIIILIYCVISTAMFNCFRIDITEQSMTIYKIYGGCTILTWNEIESVGIGKSTIEIPLIGSSKEMTIKISGKGDFSVNIEPVEREEMLDYIEALCGKWEIPFSN